MQKKISFLCLCYILRAIRAGSCRERRYADHIFIHTYFRMHHFVVRFSKFSSPHAGDKGALTPLTKKSCGRSWQGFTYHSTKTVISEPVYWLFGTEEKAVAWVWYSETALCEFPIAARLVANRYTFVTSLTYVHKYDTLRYEMIF